MKEERGETMHNKGTQPESNHRLYMTLYGMRLNHCEQYFCLFRQPAADKLKSQATQAHMRPREVLD